MNANERELEKNFDKMMDSKMIYKRVALLRSVFSVYSVVKKEVY